MQTKPEPLVHIVKEGSMLAACGVHRSAVEAAHIDAAAITCRGCRDSPEFRALTPVVSAMICDDPKHSKKMRRGFVRYKFEHKPKKDK